jgi:hypothetical protein
VIDEPRSNVSEAHKGRGDPLYWSRFNSDKKLTEFGLFPSGAQAEDVFFRKDFRGLRDRMRNTNEKLSVTATYRNGDGKLAKVLVHLSLTPEGLICGETPEETITAAPEFSDGGAVWLRKELPWNPEEDLLVVLARLRRP